MPDNQSTPEAVDVHVGATIRGRRKALGMSQENLADALRVTAQQIQKYETAGSRISASKLFMAADALGVRVAYFFDDLYQPGSEPERAATELMQPLKECPEGPELASVFPQIMDPEVRKHFLSLARAMAGSSRPPLGKVGPSPHK